MTVTTGHIGATHWRNPYPVPSRQATTTRRLDPARLGDHVDRLYRAARAMSGSREEAEDFVQETFARVLQRPRFLRSEDEIGYLLRALRNTFVSGRRRAARRPQLDVPDELMRIEDLSALREREATITTRLHRARQRVAAALAEESGIGPAVQLGRVEAATATGTGAPPSDQPSLQIRCISVSGSPRGS